MKTKQTTRERKQEREIILVNNDLKDEFGDVLNSDVLDEEVLVLCLMEEDE